MKVLITGGMGVMGAEASRRFVQEGHRPVIFARHRDEWLIRDILDKVDIELGDVLDMPRLLDVIKRHRITHIVHAAGFVGAVSAANPALSIQVNVMGTVNVLEAARAFDVKRVVYTSSKGVYGPALGEYGAPTYKPVPEDHPKSPRRIYDSAKLMAEQAGLYYQANMGVDVVVLRFATTYGPGKTARHGSDQRDRGKSRERATLPPRARRRREGRFHLQQGFCVRHLSRLHGGKPEEPRLQYRHRRRRHAQRCRARHPQASAPWRHRDRTGPQFPRHAVSCLQRL